MKLFLAITVAFLALALNTIEIEANPAGTSGHVNANVQFVGN